MTLFLTGERWMIDEQQLVRTLLGEQVRALAYIQSIVRRSDVADDVFQDVCALAVERREQINDEQHLRGWLRKSARILALNKVRERRNDRLVMADDIFDLLEPVWDEEDTVDSVAYAELLRQCMALLSEKHRELLDQRFVKGYGYAQLATESGRKAGSLYVTFSRIFAFLGKCISGRRSAGAEGCP